MDYPDRSRTCGVAAASCGLPAANSTFEVIFMVQKLCRVLCCANVRRVGLLLLVAGTAAYRHVASDHEGVTTDMDTAGRAAVRLYNARKSYETHIHHAHQGLTFIRVEKGTWRVASHYMNITEWNLTVAAGLSSCEHDPELHINGMWPASDRNTLSFVSSVGWEHSHDDCPMHDHSVNTPHQQPNGER